MAINSLSLLLDQSAWDLVLDTNGDIAVASAPYSVAQDVACAVRTFLKECWYDQSRGIPYWTEILGQLPPLSYVRKTIENVALGVANVSQARVVFVSFTNRELSGQIHIIDTDGNPSSASF